jgi:hypothetical protein
MQHRRAFGPCLLVRAPSPGLSIRRRQPSHGKLNLTVGKLTPIFDNGRIATHRTLTEDLASLTPSLLHWQSEIFMWQAVIVAFALVANIARPGRDTVRSSHCVYLNVGGTVVPIVGMSAF